MMVICQPCGLPSVERPSSAETSTSLSHLTSHVFTKEFSLHHGNQVYDGHLITIRYFILASKIAETWVYTYVAPFEYLSNEDVTFRWPNSFESERSWLCVLALNTASHRLAYFHVVEPGHRNVCGRCFATLIRCLHVSGQDIKTAPACQNLCFQSAHWLSHVDYYIISGNHGPN